VNTNTDTQLRWPSIDKDGSEIIMLFGNLLIGFHDFTTSITFSSLIQIMVGNEISLINLFHKQEKPLLQLMKMAEV
jgi:hypothetical protein